jgi:hypothetical protein
MKLCIRNSAKNAHFVISLIIKYLSNAYSEAKTDICATECRIHKCCVQIKATIQTV